MTGDTFFIKDGLNLGIIVYSMPGSDECKARCTQHNDQNDPEDFVQPWQSHAKKFIVLKLNFFGIYVKQVYMGSSMWN